MQSNGFDVWKAALLLNQSSIILFHRIKTELYHIPVLVKHSNIVNVCSSFFIQLIKSDGIVKRHGQLLEYGAI